MIKLAIIYMGGTFGCIGHPLQPMPAPDFLKKLKSLSHLNQNNINFFAAPNIKDSTELNATDWLQLAVYIQELSAQFQHFIIIHGTDTLSYAATFLHHLFKQKYHILFTGSQFPLLTEDTTELLHHSDAWNNLLFTIQHVEKIHKGVYISFNQEIHFAYQCYKQHTEQFNAFYSSAEIHHPIPYLPNDFTITNTLIEQSRNIRIVNLYLSPISTNHLNIEVHNILKNPPHILVFQGFGSGNLPYSIALEHSLKQLIAQGCWVIISSQVLYGAISQKYAVGSWLRNINLVFDPHYSQADLYARATLLYLQYGDQANWQQYWV